MTDENFLGIENSLWEALNLIREENFKNGRTAAYWDIHGTLQRHIIRDKCRLDIDDFDYAGKIFEVIHIVPREDSTAVELTFTDGVTTDTRTVASHQIEWIK